MKKFELVSSSDVSISNKEIALRSRNGSFYKKSKTKSHNWITVINPTNHRLLLQACDHCGVVKSENSILRICKAPKDQHLVSGLMTVDVEKVS